MGVRPVAANARALAGRRLRTLALGAVAAAVLAWLGLAAGFGVWLADGTGSAQAQQATRPVIVVPAVVKAQPASRTALQIQVNPASAVGKNSFIRIRGLPFAAALSEGHAIAPGAWAVPLNALSSLSVVLPVGLQGASEISISLVSVEGTILAEAKTMLTVETVAAAGQRVDPAATREPIVVRPLPPEERERALGLHAKGQEQIERGNVYAARKFFERAVEIGLAQSAVALAATYDPDELGKMRVVGLEPDPAAARKWYEKARELGAPEANERLSRLGAAR